MFTGDIGSLEDRESHSPWSDEDESEGGIKERILHKAKMLGLLKRPTTEEEIIATYKHVAKEDKWTWHANRLYEMEPTEENLEILMENILIYLFLDTSELPEDSENIELQNYSQSIYLFSLDKMKTLPVLLKLLANHNVNNPKTGISILELLLSMDLSYKSLEQLFFVYDIKLPILIEYIGIGSHDYWCEGLDDEKRNIWGWLTWGERSYESDIRFIDDEFHKLHKISIKYSDEVIKILEGRIMGNDNFYKEYKGKMGKIQKYYAIEYWKALKEHLNQKH